MTSFTRGPGNCYGPFKEPKYNAISYTWGRWELPGGHSLSVHEVSWKVPAVSPECFTVAEFRNMIRRASRDADFVWIDVACIDQGNNAVKMAEVGRQAQIFSEAANTFVWLHTLGAVSIQAQFDQLSRATARLQDEIDENDEENNMDDSSDIIIPECLADDSWISSVIEVLKAWRGEPWFTSLWTLQEIYLSTCGILLSRDSSIASQFNHHAIP